MVLAMGIESSVVHGINPGKQLTSGRSADRCYMKIREPDTFVMQLIKMRRFQYRVAKFGKITIALIVSHDKDDIWSFIRICIFTGKERQDTQCKTCIMNRPLHENWFISYRKDSNLSLCVRTARSSDDTIQWK